MTSNAWRRALAVTALCAIGLGPVAAQAEMIKIGLLRTTPGYAVDEEKGFIAKMKELGYVEGENVEYLTGVVGSRVEDFPANAEMAKKMLAQGAALMATIGTQASVPVWPVVKETKVPMVFGGVTYPVEGGLIEAFNKPTGANITGISYGVPPTLRLSLIRKIFPDRAKFQRMAFVYSSSVPQEKIYSDNLRTLADTSGWKLEFVDIANAETKKPDFDSLLGQLKALDPDAVMGWFTLDDLITNPERIVKLQAACRKPLLGLTSASTDDGALGGVLTDHFALGAQQAVMAVRVLKGENPGDIMPEQPKKYLIELNLKKAKELGIELPATIIAGASRVVK